MKEALQELAARINAVIRVRIAADHAKILDDLEAELRTLTDEALECNLRTVDIIDRFGKAVGRVRTRNFGPREK